MPIAATAVTMRQTAVRRAIRFAIVQVSVSRFASFVGCRMFWTSSPQGIPQPPNRVPGTRFRIRLGILAPATLLDHEACTHAPERRDRGHQTILTAASHPNFAAGHEASDELRESLDPVAADALPTAG
jgi:hypothetical protein